MKLCKSGSIGDDVARIQKALQSAGFYSGATDGIFASLTEAAVKKFQASSGLTADGIVGPGTWGKLFPQSASSRVSSAPPAQAPGGLDACCLALTGSFESGKLAPDCFACLAGNFDGQGMSFGALQWNFGQGTLQPLLQELFTDNADLASAIFGSNLNRLQQAVNGSREGGLAFANSIQDQAKKIITAPWRQMFRELGLTPEFQAIEVKGAAAYYGRAVTLCRQYGLSSKRGRALMFDIAVQNGSIGDAVKSKIMAGFAGLSRSLSPEELEVEKMRIVANRRAEAASSKYVEDVRQRKLCIAEGRGTVHGITYDLAGQFGLDLGDADAA